METFELFRAIFRKSLLRNSRLNHYILNTIFYNRKVLTSFLFRSCLNTGTLEIFLSLDHFSH